MIRAAHVIRHDHNGRFGGDVVHLRANVAALRAEGIDAVEVEWHQIDGDVDVIHLYNLDLPLELRAHVAEARGRWPGAKVVITPIFWPWRPASVLRAREPAIAYRAARNAAKAWLTWLPVRRALVAADAVCPCSERELGLLAGYYRIRDTRSWRAAPTGVWIKDWPARSAPPDRARLAKAVGLAEEPATVVTSVGRIEPLKNQLSLVKAVAQVPGASLVLVGADRDRGYAERVMKLGRRALPGRFAWIDRIPHHEVQQLLADTDIHALLSFREVASLSSLEGGAAGCEVVVTRWSSTEEYYGDTAHYCEPHDVASIVAAIDHAMASPRQPALRERIEARFDWSMSARIVAGCYRDAIARS
jgi:glycosyltransferase involved in cell wall biosynthesis